MTAQKKSFSRTAIIDAPIEVVWEIISRGGGVNEWMPFITTCRLDQQGHTTNRYCETADGNLLKETIDLVDHDNHIFAYTIVEQDMMPLTDYQGKFGLKSTTTGKTEVTWSATFLIEEEHYPEIAEGLSGLYQLGFDGLETVAKQTIE